MDFADQVSVPMDLIGSFMIALQSFLGKRFKADEKSVTAAFGRLLKKHIVFGDVKGSMAEPFDPEIFEKGEEVHGVDGVPDDVIIDEEDEFVPLPQKFHFPPDLFQGTQAVGVPVEGGHGTKVAMEGAAAADLHGVDEEIAPLFQKVATRYGEAFQDGQVAGFVKSLRRSFLKVFEHPGPNPLGFPQDDSIRMLPGLLGHPGGVEASHDHGDGHPAKTVGDGIPSVGQRGDDADGH